MLTLILLTTLALPPNAETLVLRSGQRIAIEGAVPESKGRVTFRAGGQHRDAPPGAAAPH